MDVALTSLCTAFVAGRCVASGDPGAVAAALGALPVEDRGRAVVVDDLTGRTVEAWSGDAPLGELSAKRGRGRPKLGVTAREVTLLPRHWEWLATQSGGASAVLRRLVEEARRDPAAQRREAREATHRAMTTLAGDFDGYEGALRALYAGDDMRFTIATRKWPADVRDYLLKIAQTGWEKAA